MNMNKYSKDQLKAALADALQHISELKKTASDRKLVEDAMQVSEIRYRRLFETAQDGILILDADTGHIIDVNPFLINMLGYSLDEILGKKLWEIGPFRDTDASKASFEKLQREGYVRYEDLPLQTKDGRNMNVEFVSNTYQINHGKVIQCNIRDITVRKQYEEELQRYREQLEDIVRERTIELEKRNIQLEAEISERKKAEDALRRASAYNRSLIEAILDPLVTIDAEGMITDVNKATEKMTGKTRLELIGTDFSDYFTEPDKARIVYKQVFNEGLVQDYPLSILHSDTHVTPVLYNAATYRDEKKNIAGVIASARDITERKKAEEEKKQLEEELIQVQKMEALGRFAGGIAHDLNNILYPIIINIESLLEEAVPGSSMHLLLEQVLKAAHRQKELVKQILSFSRRSPQKHSPLKVTPLIKETLNFLRSSLPSTIKIQQHIDISSDMILGEPTQIQQVIMNLFRNGADALGSQGGTIQVTLTNTYLEPTPAQPEMIAGQYLQLTVRDTGQGMTPEVMNRIFDPFFTTKEIGKGSGMGLSVVHGILNDHGGTITVESEPGKGSQFTVFLPITSEEFGWQTHQKEKPLSLRRKIRILFVDDDEIIISSVQNALKRLGHDVVAAINSLEALELFSKSPDKFDLVITDLTMPQISGVVLAKKLMDTRPDIPVIVSTGYSDAIDEQEAISLGIRVLIEKPATIRELDSAIRKALEV
jgi:two-component system, cell cycle sensor histidine kinase and response regulator CckA